MSKNVGKDYIDSVIHEDLHTGGVYAATVDGKILNYEERGRAAFSYNFMLKEMKKLVGQVLTVIDASYTNERQLKAVKDMIRNHFADAYCKLWEASEARWREIIDESSKNLPDEYFTDEKNQVSLEEVVGA